MTDEYATPLLDTTRLEGLPAVGDGSGLSPDDRFYKEEVQLALRNHGMPLEGMRYPVTPTGLHYVLVHFDIPVTDAGDWRLTVDGLVRRSLSLSLNDIRARPAVTLPVTMECAGNGRAHLDPRAISQPWMFDAIGTATWTGTPLKGILEEAELADSAFEIVFTGVDWGVQGGQIQPYQRSLSVDEATRDEVLIVYAMNGEPLQPQHGYPLRLIVPGWFGMTSVKWLANITAVAEPFQGYQMTGSYRIAPDRDDPGEAVTLIQPRALMIPPGIPDFATRLRVLREGPVTLAGRAWAGRVGIARVEVSIDNGAHWDDAELETPVSDFAWRGWSYGWHASAGRYVLCVRATDANGNPQPLEQPWNYQGMGNNMAQRVEVLVL